MNVEEGKGAKVAGGAVFHISADGYEGIAKAKSELVKLVRTGVRVGAVY